MSNKDKKILDSDADGLLDSEEKVLGTNPNDPDTDHDDLGDYQEVRVYKTDPLDPDSDKDGIGDGTEVKMGRNPRGKGSLKDLFIPSEANNYKPHALHPKRLAFHAVSAIVIKVIMVAFVMSFPLQAWLSPDILYEQAKRIIALTNNIRQDLSIPVLRENPVLNQAALNKAEDMMIDQYFAHVSPDNKSLRTWLSQLSYSFKVAGENLAIGFSSANDVVAAWQESPTHYSNIVDPDFTEIGVGVVSGDYNGYETTLVAQYFGDPYVVEPVVEQPVVIETNTVAQYDAKVDIEEQIALNEPVDAPESSEEPVLEPVVENLDNQVEDQVLAEKEAIELKTPVFTNVEDKALLSDKINSFSILAPGAQRVSIYDNNELILSKVLEGESIEIPIKLEEGEHNLQIVAYQGESTKYSNGYLVAVDITKPVIDQENSTIVISQPEGQEDIVVKTIAFLSPDTEEAFVDFAGQTMQLNRDYTQEGKWTGHQVISGVDYDSLFNPVVLATLTATDQAGNTVSQDLQWQDIKPAAASALSQYSFIKNSNSKFIDPLFDISSIYYRLILAIAIIALLLNIFIQIRKQHVGTIASTLGLIALLSFLTIF